MESKIKLIRGRIEEVTLNEPVVDVLVSEWMGYFLLFEGMLDSVIYARNKYLAPNGIILPNACSIEIMAVGDSGENCCQHRNVSFVTKTAFIRTIL